MQPIIAVTFLCIHLLILSPLTSFLRAFHKYVINYNEAPNCFYCNCSRHHSLIIPVENDYYTLFFIIIIVFMIIKLSMLGDHSREYNKPNEYHYLQVIASLSVFPTLRKFLANDISFWSGVQEKRLANKPHHVCDARFEKKRRMGSETQSRRFLFNIAGSRSLISRLIANTAIKCSPPRYFFPFVFSLETAAAVCWLSLEFLKK